ncbi:MAG TPA: carboxymuconolactone decarboxylase family protein [Candidatus Baltobacteraceae bacterium]|jgi:AhpD family alkylhydroperoxidase|nr:carboxymuconolactone decarboxylase family protein [Candidatus Baltobacteraceae bacterium]
MPAEINVQTASPEVVAYLGEGGKLLAKSGLDEDLLVLVELRTSQINGCAFCLALHSRQARARGETDDRIVGLSAWREAPWYGERERLALEWTEALTNISTSHKDVDEIRPRLKEHFSDREIAFLTLAVTLINSWNRFSIGFANPPEEAERLFQALHAVAAHG